MHNVNRVTLLGRTGQEPITRTLPNGRTITRVSIATNKSWKDLQGEWQSKTTWHSCVAYGPVANYVAQMEPGSLVYMEGEITFREYEREIETDHGPVKVMWPVTEIIVETANLILRKRDQTEERGAA